MSAKPSPAISTFGVHASSCNPTSRATRRKLNGTNTVPSSAEANMVSTN